MLRTGNISEDALIWRDDLDTWLPAKSLFGDATNLRLDNGLKQASRSPSKFQLVFAATVSAAAIAATLSIFLHIQPDVAKPLHKIWQAMGISIAISSIILKVLLSGSSVILLIAAIHSEFRKFKPGLSGGILSGLSIVVAAAIILSLTTIYNAKLIIAADRAARQLDDYSLLVDDESRSASLVGDVGAGLFDQLSSFDRRIGGIRTFEIESHGGLIDEALKVSELLEQRKAVVVARRSCDSACTVIALSSPNSYADQTMRFGFHGVYSLIESDAEVTKVGVQELAETVRQRLIAHGVPAATMDDAGRLSQDELLYVTARSLFQEGALAGLVLGNDITTP